MKQLIVYGYLIALFFNTPITLAEEACIDHAKTQRDLNICAFDSLNEAQQALDRLLIRIKEIYAKDARFLEKLEISQEKWKLSFEADMEMKYPEANKRKYGSVFPMCANNVARDLIRVRINYLSQWTLGDMEGEVCSGSVIPNRVIEQMKSAVE